jgi:hypothetical protein
MKTVLAHRRLTGLIATLAILAASLAPAFIHVRASATDATWIEICTTQGPKWIQADKDGSERTPASAHLLENCSYCSTHAPALGLPPATVLAHLHLQLSHIARLAFPYALRILNSWVSAQPRAPPLFS